MRKLGSKLFFVHHSQMNNPPGLSPGRPVKLISTRSAYKLLRNKKYLIKIKSAKATLVGLELRDKQAQALYSAFSVDFMLFLSVISGKDQILTNKLELSSHVADGNTPLSQKNETTLIEQLEAPFLVNTHLFSNVQEVGSGGNVYGNYYLPVPQATSKYLRATDVLLVSPNTLTQVELSMEISGMEGFVVPNFVSHNITSSIDINSSGLLGVDYNSLVQDYGTPVTDHKISIHTAQILAEIWEI